MLALINEELWISVLVLGRVVDREDPGPLVDCLIGRRGDRMRVPDRLVPARLMNAAIDAAT